MKAQSSYSSWYFIERATIGEIRVNCTIALSSQILSSGTRRPTAADPAKQQKTLFGKAIGELPFVMHVQTSCKHSSIKRNLLCRLYMYHIEVCCSGFAGRMLTFNLTYRH